MRMQKCSLLLRLDREIASPGIPQGKSGIPGAVVQKGRVLNVPDVYEHADFDASGDQASGTKTTCLLGAPILGQDGVPVAVLVALNKNGGGVFDRADEEVMVVFAGQIAVLLSHALLSQESALAEQQAQRLMEFLREVCRGDLKSPRALIAAVASGGMDLVEADRCSFYMKDDSSDDLWSLSTEQMEKCSISPWTGILGYVATRGETINVADAATDPRFDKSH